MKKIKIMENVAKNPDSKPNVVKKISKIFSVYIRDKEYDVYNIIDKEHEGWNNVPTTWWLYFTNKLPENVFPDINSKDLIPFDIGINRRLWEIKIVQKNTHKIKWNDHRFSNNTNVEMWCNKKLIYSFGTHDLNFAMAKAQYLEIVLSEHPFNFFNAEEENGRKICYHGLPATVRVHDSHTWEIDIIPDYSTGLNEKEWWDELKRRESKVSNEDEQDIQWEKEWKEESRECGFINWGDALSDGNIYWFRK